MVGIVIVTHSPKTAEGICEMAVQMARPGQKIIPAGGTADRRIGTDAAKIGEAIAAADEGDGVVVMVDLGSAVLSAETALEFVDPELRARTAIADAPVVEGAISAVVQASLGGSLNEVLTTAESARNLRKK
ncbi:MAG TPA: dihydroxyacetone kinase phosphoryl donor subunit DhaM [Selenomonadales bacterium]|nr:dihydroxyacetone kinase phosphoryl donor subunit DhaM [Selenomonadales bacterium]